MFSQGEINSLPAALPDHWCMVAATKFQARREDE